MTPFAIVGTVYLILLAICFAVSAASLAVIAAKLPKRSTPKKSVSDMTMHIDVDTSEFEQQMKGAIELARMFQKETKDMPIITSWPTKNGDSVEHGEG